METWLIAALASILVSTAVSAEPRADQSSVSEMAASPEDVTIYEAVLDKWLGKERRPQLIDIRLSAPPARSGSNFADCTKGLDFPETPFSQARSLAGARFNRPGVTLIDGSTWQPLDPSQTIAEGRSVKAAVDAGFAQSLIAFSQVAFSRDGRDALVEFTMICGRLCGNGTTFHLHKTATEWAVLGQCGSSWVS